MFNHLKKQEQSNAFISKGYFLHQIQFQVYQLFFLPFNITESH